MVDNSNSYKDRVSRLISWGHWFMLLFYSDLYDYSIPTERLDRVRRRIFGNGADVAFLMKDLVLFAASFYLLRQDVIRASSSKSMTESQEGIILNEAPRGRGLDGQAERS